MANSAIKDASNQGAADFAKISEIYCRMKAAGFKNATEEDKVALKIIIKRMPADIQRDVMKVCPALWD